MEFLFLSCKENDLLIFLISLFENFIYLFLTVLGLPGCTGLSLAACGGYCLVVVRGLLIAVACFVVEHRL